MHPSFKVQGFSQANQNSFCKFLDRRHPKMSLKAKIGKPCSIKVLKPSPGDCLTWEVGWPPSAHHGQGPERGPGIQYEPGGGSAKGCWTGALDKPARAQTLLLLPPASRVTEKTNILSLSLNLPPSKCAKEDHGPQRECPHTTCGSWRGSPRLPLVTTTHFEEQRVHQYSLGLTATV